MRRNVFSVVMALLLFSAWEVKSQNTMYFMDRLPYNLNYNPALVPEVGFFISLPGIGLEQAEMYNSGFNAGEFMDFLDAVESENYDPQSFIGKLESINKTFLETRSNIFSFGFRLKRNGYFSVSMTERNFAEVSAPREVLYFLDDYENFEDKMPLTINGINVSMNAFTQLAFTLSKMYMDKLTIGISPKLTGALAAFRSSDGHMKAIREGAGEYETQISASSDVGLPLPINPAAVDQNGELDEDESLLEDEWEKNFSSGDLFKNAGFSLDLGLHFKLNDEWSFSGSVLDLGKSKWKNNDYLFSFTDSVIKVSPDNHFAMKIPSKIYLAASYNLSEKWNTGVVLRSVFFESENHTSATLSLNGHVGRMLSTSVSYTAAHKFDNIGLGLRLRFLPGADLFFVTDNILHAFNYKSAQHASLSVGMNLAFGIREKLALNSPGQPEEGK